ncbi:hypothetical protein BDN72DRAFT_850146 [Pluteus cervinus]|uniref:Uncharacterized protein n=1 Tax=Pluteus cervinus TaxID=181527 RepID=A0ACD3A6K1_9AGAR|nr:hypothetical protein BDN72DRAFT_850146 [Pluteus cervinus]
MASTNDVVSEGQPTTRSEDNLPNRRGSENGSSGREDHSLNHPGHSLSSSSNESASRAVNNGKDSVQFQGDSPSKSTSPTASSTSTRSQSNLPEGESYEGLDPHVYPPQKHAGKVGYGPHFHEGPGFFEKMGGFKETMLGKMTHNHDKAEHGHDKMTGELKHKELEEDANPFQQADKQADNASPSLNKPNDAKRVGSEKGDKEQAATVAPQGAEPEKHLGQL